MSHFYAFDRKQSLLLLLTGILLAVLVCLLGWIVGLLMRPAPETAAPAAAQNEAERRPGAPPTVADASSTQAAPPDAMASPQAVDPPAPEAGVRRTTAEARSAGQNATRKAAAVMESARGAAPGTAPAGPSSSSGSAANSTESSDASAPSPAGSAEAAEPDPESAPQVPTDATGVPPENGSEEPAPDFGPDNRFVVVADTFVVGSKAKARVAELKGKGYKPRLLETPAAETAGRMGLYSVILGDYSRMETAEAAAQRFREAGGGTPLVRSVPATELPPDGSESGGSAALESADEVESIESESASPSAG